MNRSAHGWIESAKNPQVKALLRLQERRTREREARTVVEGVREVQRAFEAGLTLEAAYVAPDLLATEGHLLEQTLASAGIPVTGCARAAFERISGRQGPDGVLAVVQVPQLTLETLVLPGNPLLLVAVATEKPGNLGALIRTADAAGVDALLLARGDEAAPGTDPWNPNVIRASMGSVFHLPVVEASGATLRPWLQQRGVRIAVTDPNVDANLWDVPLTGPLAIVLGAEHAGLPAPWREAAQLRIGIPMRGAADSLNVSVSGALTLYEALRQRSRANR